MWYHIQLCPLWVCCPLLQFSLFCLPTLLLLLPSSLFVPTAQSRLLADASAKAASAEARVVSLQEEVARLSQLLQRQEDEHVSGEERE